MQLPSLLDFGPSSITLGHCYKIVNTYKLEFPSERYVNAILFLGSSQEQYQKSKGVKIILANKDGIPIKTYDFSSDLSAFGQEIVVQAYCKTIRV
jgi:hypothetical protein